MRKGMMEAPAVTPAPARPRPSEASRHQPGWRTVCGEIEGGAQPHEIGRTPKPETEKRILEEVGSYGSQIGRILDAMEVLFEALAADPNGPLSRDRLDEAEIDKLKKFAELLRAVDDAKRD